MTEERPQPTSPGPDFEPTGPGAGEAGEEDEGTDGVPGDDATTEPEEDE